LCDPLAARKDRVGGLARLVPALVPILCDRDRYEQTFLDRDLKLDVRVSALSVLAMVGADLGAIYQRLKSIESDPAKVERWNPWFVALCAQTPFPDAIPLLEAQMKSPDEPSIPIIVSALTKLGGLPVPAATAMAEPSTSPAREAERARFGSGLTITAPNTVCIVRSRRPTPRMCSSLVIGTKLRLHYARAGLALPSPINQ